MIAIPDISWLASNAGRSIEVGIGRASGDAVSIVADGIACALAAWSSDQIEVAVAEVVIVGRCSKGEITVD